MKQLQLMNIIAHITLKDYVSIHKNALRSSDRGFAIAVLKAAIIKFGVFAWSSEYDPNLTEIYGTNTTPYVSDVPYLSPEVNLLFDHADIDVLCQLCHSLMNPPASDPDSAFIVGSYCIERWGDDKFYKTMGLVIPHISEAV